MTFNKKICFSPVTTCVFVLLFFVSVNGFTQSSSEKEILFYCDSTASLPFETVKSAEFSNRFQPLKHGKINYDISRAKIWIKFRIALADTIPRFLQLSSANLHTIDFYKPIQGTEIYTKTETGFLRPFASRPIQTSNITLPFTKDEWSFASISSGHFLNTDFKIVQSEELFRNSSGRIVFYSLYAGIMFIIVAGIFTYAFHSKEYYYLFYFGYILFISTINLTEKGFYFQFLWPELPSLNYYFPLLPYGVSFCLLLFLKKTFQIDKSARVLYQFTFFVVTIALLFPTVYFLLIGNYGTAFIIAQIHGMAIGLLVLALNIICYFKSKENRPFLRLIIIGLCFFCAGVITYLTAENEFCPLNFFTENAIVVGTTIEVCFFTASISLYQSSLSKKYYDLIAVQNEKLQEGIKERTLELQQKNEALRNSLEEKENLMNIVVHDLKSPLNQTKALSNIIGGIMKGDEEVQDMLLRIQTANDHGLKLIDELNTIASLEADSRKLVLEKTNVIENLTTVLKNFEALAKKKSITLCVEGHKDCIVSTHSPYLIRIIENLLSNAVKFSSMGSTIRFVVKKNETAEISICDQGPGFSEEDQKKMFRKFQRLSASPTGGEHSTGLGLYIVKLLTTRINAELYLKSQVGQGSDFTIRFKEAG